MPKQQNECRHKDKYKYKCSSCEETHCEKCDPSVWSTHSVCGGCDILVEHYDDNLGMIRDDYFHGDCLVNHLRYEHPPLELHLSTLEKQVEELRKELAK